jgi:hypothetical protein
LNLSQHGTSGWALDLRKNRNTNGKKKLYPREKVCAWRHDTYSGFITPLDTNSVNLFQYIYTYSIRSRPVQNTARPHAKITKCSTHIKIKKVNQSLYRPITGPGGSRRLNLPDFETIGIYKRKGCQPYAPAAFTPHEIFLVLISVTGRVDPRTTMRPEGSCE